MDIDYLGDHGPAYCFFAGDGKAVLLVGQWLLKYRKFPSLAFRLTRWSDKGKPIRMEVIGKRVKPEHSAVSLKGNYSYKDVEVFNASPVTLQQDLQKAFGNGAALALIYFVRRSPGPPAQKDGKNGWTSLVLFRWL